MVGEIYMNLRHTPRRNFWPNDRGAAAVEFALVAMPLITLIFASLQIAALYFFDQALQTGTQKAARQLMTGAAQTSNTNQAQFKTVVCNNLPSVFTCGNLMVDVESGSNFSSISTTPLTPTYSGNTVTNNWSYSPGNPGDIVIVRVMYDWPVLGGPLGLGLANQPNSTHLMVATTVFKNEPYQ